MKRLPSFFAGYLLLILFSTSALADVLIVANKSVTETAISKTNIQQIFLGKNQKWQDGKKIRLAVLKEGPVHEAFLSAYLNRTPDRYASFWKVAIVSGTGYPPKSFDSEADLLKYVAEEAGAIGYISSDTPHNEVTVITTE
jgi:ABC-type phosphate transport system substrate-binding protein